MYERFTEKAIKVILLAQEEARRLGCNFVDTEQIFLGLICEGTGNAARTLRSVGVSLKDARTEVEKIIGCGPGSVAIKPFTLDAEQPLEFSPGARAALKLTLFDRDALGDYYYLRNNVVMAYRTFSEANDLVDLAPAELRSDITYGMSYALESRIRYACFLAATGKIERAKTLFDRALAKRDEIQAQCGHSVGSSNLEECYAEIIASHDPAPFRKIVLEAHGQ